METTTDWQNTIEAIIEQPGVTMIVGDIDAGKTTFTKELANAGVSAGIPTAIVDADTGQSEIGPPAAIGMTIVEEPIESLRSLKVRRMYFVGSTTPVGHLLPTVIGVKRMADEAITRGARLVVVDTSGLVNGTVGRKLKLYKIDLLSPKHIIGLQKHRELDAILSVAAHIDKYTVHRLKVSPETQEKPKAFRTARRKNQFFDYFRNADRHLLRLDEIVCWGTLFTTGRLVKWQHFRVLERTLRTKVLHAEIVGNGMYIVAECRPQMAGIQALMERYSTRQFTVVCGTDFNNVLIGLADGNANTIGLGIIEAVDFKQRHMSVITPASTITPVRVVQFGSMRIRMDGAELGRIKPGEI